MILINRKCPEPVDSCCYYYLFDVSVKKTEAVTLRRSVKMCSYKLLEILRKPHVPKSLQVGGLELYKNDSDRGSL